MKSPGVNPEAVGGDGDTRGIVRDERAKLATERAECRTDRAKLAVELAERRQERAKVALEREGQRMKLEEERAQLAEERAKIAEERERQKAAKATPRIKYEDHVVRVRQFLDLERRNSMPIQSLGPILFPWEGKV